MDIAERIVSGYASMVYLGVGMHSGYGSAQRMYIKGAVIFQMEPACGMAKKYANLMQIAGTTMIRFFYLFKFLR